MGEVISLDAARQQRLQQEAPASYTDVMRRLTNLQPGYVSLGAIVVLTHVVFLIYEGQAELSYTYLCDRIGITRPTLSKYIDELEDRELINVLRARKDVKYNRPNRFEIDFNGPLGTDNMLKLPKKPREMGSKKNLLPDPKVVKNLYCYKDNINKGILIPKGIRRTSAPEFDNISDAVAHTEKRITRKRAEKVATATKRNAQLTLAGVKATWAAAMLKRYPTVPPVVVTAKDFAILKQRLIPLLSVCNLSEVFDYFVDSWQSLRETRFKWLRAQGKDIALAPSLPELMRYWKIFAQAFADSRMATTRSVEEQTAMSSEQALREELAQARAAQAAAAAEANQLRQRVAKAERMASAPTRKTEDAPVSLTERRRRADEAYNKGTDLPDWK